MPIPFALVQAEQEPDFRITAKDIVRLLTALQQNQLPEMLLPEDVERILRSSHYTVSELLKRKEIPAFKLGKNWKIPRDPFLQWMAEKAEEGAEISIT